MDGIRAKSTGGLWRARRWRLCAALLACAAGLLPQGEAQVAPSPAGTATATVPEPGRAVLPADVTPKQRREAEDAYLKGARALERKDLDEAEALFAHAVQLNAANQDYRIALAVTREHRLVALVQRAAQASALGHTDEADRLLVQAREIDPQNAVVRQHFGGDGAVVNAGQPMTAQDSALAMRSEAAQSLAPPVQLTPAAGVHDLHLRATARELLTQVCRSYGIRANVTESVTAGPVLRMDLDHASFEEALRTAEALTDTFSVPLEPTALLFARDSRENRDAYEPLVEETLYLPGTTQAQLTEYANMARNVFNLRVVNAVSSTGSLVLRGDEATLKRLNATFEDLVGGDAEVLLDLSLYEVQTSRINNVGVQLPSSLGAFPIVSTAENLISANQSLISEAVANNLITLTGNPYTDALTELEFLIASGTVSSSEFSNLLGVFGHYGGLPLAGAFLGSTTAVNAALTSSDVRLLDTVQLRVGDRQDGQFRAGTRYPIETGIYSSSTSSAVSSAVAGLTINGTSVSSLLSQYLGSTAVSVPQIQFEDLGLTLKATSVQVERSGDVQLKLDFKVESLGSGTINTLPVLNSRQLISAVTIPAGQTALLASQVSTSEFRAVTGLPFLSEIPGFQSTNKDTEKDTDEVMITLTPHVVRSKRMNVVSRRLALPNDRAVQQAQ